MLRDVCPPLFPIPMSHDLSWHQLIPPLNFLPRLLHNFSIRLSLLPCSAPEPQNFSRCFQLAFDTSHRLPAAGL